MFLIRPFSLSYSNSIFAKLLLHFKIGCQDICNHANCARDRAFASPIPVNRTSKECSREGDYKDSTNPIATTTVGV